MSNLDYKNAYVIVEKLLKKTQYEKTEVVYLSLDDGQRIGPYIRKTFDLKSGLGNIYKQIFGEKFFNSKSNYLPEIIEVYDKGSQLIVLEEYLDGQTLDKYIAHQIYDEHTLCKIFIDLCNAVIFLHSNFSMPIIHRDIKPSNVYITKSGHLKLIDFGISRNYEENEMTDTHKFGTVGYASPEQFGFKQTDVRSDIYSMGKVLEFLCNIDNWKSNKVKVENNYYQDIINKACQFDPNFRYKNVLRMLHDFQKLNISKNKTLLTFGHIWNILITVIFLFFVFIVFYTILDPSNGNYQMSVGQKICYSVMMIIFLSLGSWAVLLYKPSARRIFKKLPKFKIIHYIISILGCIAGITICAFIGQII